MFPSCHPIHQTGTRRSHVLEYRILGTIEFGTLDPRSAESLLSQPKRLAVLAYIALARPRGPHLRETVVSLFWPHASRERGRGSLRNALHFLRRHLGSGVIRSTGDDVSVDPAVLSCDAIEFEKHLDERRYEQALALYRGELLPGLRVQDSPRFATWLEGERGRLQDGAARAAWALAAEEEARGHWIGAIDYARRATFLSADSERAVRELMRLMDRAGDRVAALREYDAFVARWEREYGLAPSPETRNLAESIRSGLPAAESLAVGPVARRSADRRRPTSIAVLPFLVSSPQAEHAYLAAGLAHDVIASLSRLSGIRVVARTSVDHYRTRVGPASRRIAEDLGADMVLDGSLRVVGGRLIIGARLVDARTLAPAWGDVYECDASDPLSIVIRLLLDLVAALEIDLSAEEAEHLSSTPTPDREAYDHYLRGRSISSRRSKRDLDLAIRHYEQALELDPRFALALAGLADAHLLQYTAAGVRVSEVSVRAREAARAALEIDPRLGEVHATLGFLRAMMDYDWQGAEEGFRRAIELSPGHATAHHWYGSYLSFVHARFEEGARELELARQLDPLSPIICNDTALALLHRGRSREAVLKFREALELEPTLWRAHYDLGVASVLGGDCVDGVGHLRHAWALGAYGASGERSDPEDLRVGDWRAALERKLAELAASAHQRGTRGFEAALVSMLLGRREEALRWLRLVGDQGTWLIVLMYFPAFEPLSGRPEFDSYLERIGLGTRAPMA